MLNTYIYILMSVLNIVVRMFGVLYGFVSSYLLWIFEPSLENLGKRKGTKD